uniref:Uncharacterized protein n=1 Tax=Pelodiscus sinensis TaxID=13735 RepID=K7F1Z1_PELSI
APDEGSLYTQSLCPTPELAASQRRTRGPYIHSPCAPPQSWLHPSAGRGVPIYTVPVPHPRAGCIPAPDEGSLYTQSLCPTPELAASQRRTRGPYIHSPCAPPQSWLHPSAGRGVPIYTVPVPHPRAGCIPAPDEGSLYTQSLCPTPELAASQRRTRGPYIHSPCAPPQSWLHPSAGRGVPIYTVPVPHPRAGCIPAPDEGSLYTQSLCPTPELAASQRRTRGPYIHSPCAPPQSWLHPSAGRGVPIYTVPVPHPRAGCIPAPDEGSLYTQSLCPTPELAASQRRTRGPYIHSPCAPPQSWLHPSAGRGVPIYTVPVPHPRAGCIPAPDEGSLYTQSLCPTPELAASQRRTRGPYIHSPCAPPQSWLHPSAGRGVPIYTVPVPHPRAGCIPAPDEGSLYTQSL